LFCCCSRLDKVPVCQSLCIEFNATCGSYLSAYPALVQYLPACPTEPTVNCTTVEGVPPIDFDAIVCPAPLIKSNNRSIVRDNCPGGTCCIPCPLTYSFFKTNYISNIFDMLFSFIFVFSIFTLVTVISYLIHPQKRRFPQSLIPSMAFAMFISMIGSWISIFVGKENVGCNSQWDVAAPGDANSACIASTVFLIYGILASILWFGTLSFNVLLVIVLRLDVPYWVQFVYHTLCWGLPIIPVCIMRFENSMGGATYPGCGVENTALDTDGFLIPSSVVLFPAFLMNLVVFGYVWWIARQTAKSFRAILKLQMRPLMFSTYATTVFIIYWIYFNVETNPPTTWLDDWITCVALGNGQDYCSSIPKIENLGSFVAVYIIASTVGLMVFCVFVLKRDILNGWRSALRLTELESEGIYATTKAQSQSQFRSTNHSRNQSRSKADRDLEDDDDEVPAKKAVGHEEMGMSPIPPTEEVK